MEEEQPDDVFEDLTEEEEESLHKDVEMFVEKMFPILWSKHKEDFKDLSKRELAEQAYYIGIYHAMHSNQSQMKGIMKKAEELEKDPSLLKKFIEEMKSDEEKQ